MWQLIFQLLIVLIVMALIAVAIAVCWFYLSAIAKVKPKPDEFSDRLKQAVSGSGLADIQQVWIMSICLPRLNEYRRLSQTSNRRFYRLSKSSIASPYLAGAVALATTTVFQSSWLWGVLIGGLFAGIGKLASAFDAIEGNSARWRDYQEIADAIEESLTELLTETTDQPIGPRWAQFRSEYEAIGLRERELFAARTKAAQEAVSTEATAAQANLAQIKQQRNTQRVGGSNAINHLDHAEFGDYRSGDRGGNPMGRIDNFAMDTRSGGARLPQLAQFQMESVNGLDNLADRDWRNQSGVEDGDRVAAQAPGVAGINDWVQWSQQGDDDLMPSEAL